MIVDANGAVLGRLSAKIAKELLKGEQVVVINAEKAVITGNPSAVFNRYKEKMGRGDRHKGPFLSRYPDRMLKRTVRGMLPYKKEKGKQAFKKLKVFMGNPNDLKGQKLGKTTDDLRCKFITLEKIATKLGAKLG